MKVILYKRDKTFLSRLVSFVTGSEYTHTAVLIKRNGICYITDSSLTEGIVLRPLHTAPTRLLDREYEVYDLHKYSITLEHDSYNKALGLAGGKYDVMGALTYVFNKLLKKLHIFNKNKKLYCFEYALELLKCYYPLDEKLLYAPSGDTLKDTLTGLSIKTRFINCNKVG